MISRLLPWMAPAVFIWAGLTSLAQQDQPARLIGAVEITGQETITEGYIREVIRIGPGDPLDQAVLDEAVQRLLRTGRFLTADADVQERDGRTVVVFTVAERPTVTDIRFVGNVKFKDKKLRDMVPLAVGDPVDAFDVREGADNIVAAYHEKGYGNVAVEHDAELLAQTGELVYTIEEGPRVRVKKVLFEGNESIHRRDLAKQIETETYIWILRDGNFDVDQVEQDAAAVQNYYRGEGYLDARASYRVEAGAKPDDLTVVFVISEGVRYQIESVTITGNTVFTEEGLLGPLGTQPGRFILQLRLDRDVRDIQTRYGELGYIYAEVRAERVFSKTPGQVLVQITIDEGGQYRVGRVVPRGNTNTKDKVVRRALDLYPPNDLIDLTKLREAEQRLRETQIFSMATITPVGDAEGVRDLVIDVEESEQAGDFLFGFGVNSNSGLVGNIVLDIKNFDLFDWPRSFKEFIKLRSFRGAGQRLRIDASPGLEVNRFRIDFIEPYFLDTPMRFATSAYYFERGRESYDERRVGGNVSFGRRQDKGWLKGWYTEIALRAENVDVSDLDLWAPRDRA